MKLMKLTTVTLTLALIWPASLMAASDRDPSIQAASDPGQSIQSAIARVVQQGLSTNAQTSRPAFGNPYFTPALVMIGVGSALAIMADKVPQLRTQTQDYDLCAVAVGAPTGPDNRTPLCDAYTHVNRPLLWVGIGTAAVGLTMLTTSVLFRNITIQTVPGRSVAVKKVTRF
jgi:hypothetical protein